MSKISLAVEATVASQGAVAPSLVDGYGDFGMIVLFVLLAGVAGALLFGWGKLFKESAFLAVFAGCVAGIAAWGVFDALNNQRYVVIEKVSIVHWIGFFGTLAALVLLAIRTVSFIEQIKNQIDEIKLKILKDRESRFHASLQLLGNKGMSARTGAIFSLYRFAYEEEKYRHEAAQLLCLHIRSKTQEKEYQKRYRKEPSIEIQTAIDLLFRDEEGDGLYVDKDVLSDLGMASLRNAYLVGANFSGARCKSVDFSSAQLQGADFTGALCQGTIFSKAQCQSADFTDAQCQGFIFNQVQCRGADFSNAKCHGGDFEQAQCQGANFHLAQFQGAEFSQTICQGADFSYAQCQGVSFEDAQCQGAIFHMAKCQGADFSHAQCQGADFYRAQCQGVNFSNMHLQGAFLKEMQCQGAYALSKFEYETLEKELGEKIEKKLMKKYKNQLQQHSIEKDGDELLVTIEKEKEEALNREIGEGLYSELEKEYNSTVFLEERINLLSLQISKETDLQTMVFSGRLHSESIAAIKAAKEFALAPDGWWVQMQEVIEENKSKPISHAMPKDSGMITGVLEDSDEIRKVIAELEEIEKAEW